MRERKKGIFVDLNYKQSCGEAHIKAYKNVLKKSEKVGCSEEREANESFGLKINENAIGKLKLFYS